ncbi:MAG: hypothetical protein KG029_18845, partial [Bacteroidetes bacterium]|nr:hypothetical protein [Bacteroidota bacterium]
MAELKGLSSPYIQKKGQMDFIQNLTGKIGRVLLSGKMGAGLTSTVVTFVSANIPSITVKEDDPNEIIFPEYVNVVLNPSGTIQVPVDSWVLDEDMDGSAVIGTFQHEAFYTLPEHILGTPTRVFWTVNVRPVLIISGGTLNSYTGYKSRAFLSAGNLVISEISKSAKLDVLIVAGGGGGGKGVSSLGNAGGGGA